MADVDIERSKNGHQTRDIQWLSGSLKDRAEGRAKRGHLESCAKEALTCHQPHQCASNVVEYGLKRRDWIASSQNAFNEV